MRKGLIMMMAAGAIGVLGMSSSVGAPANGSAIIGGMESTAPVQDARLYCYNRYTGRFLHWGSCGGGYYYRRPGRVYCYNRYTGRFLHWGSCY